MTTPARIDQRKTVDAVIYSLGFYRENRPDRLDRECCGDVQKDEERGDRPLKAISFDVFIWN